jgi:hypothetical protein
MWRWEKIGALIWRWQPKKLLDWQLLSSLVEERTKHMPVVHVSRIHIAKHEGPHRTAHIEGFAEPVHFGIHGGIRHFYQNKYGRQLSGPEFPATLDYIIAGVAG